MNKNLSFFAIAGLVVVATIAQSPAPALAAPIYQWCMQPSAPWGPDCAYVTIEQCRAAASAVGFCHQNPAYTVATQGRPDRMRRP